MKFMVQELSKPRVYQEYADVSPTARFRFKIRYLKLISLVISSVGSIYTFKYYADGVLSEYFLGKFVYNSVALLLAVFICSFVTLISAGWTQNNFIRWMIALVVAASTIFTTTAILSSGAPPTVELLTMALDSASALSDFIAFNSHDVAISIFLGIMAFLGIGLPPQNAVGSAKAPVVLALGLGAMLLVASSDRIYAIGASVPGWSGVVLAIAQPFHASRGTIQPAPPPALRPSRPASTGDVVLIVDESIGAHYLDLNRPSGVRSGLYPAPPSVAVANFGIAASATNFSVGTNYILRTGGTRDAYFERKASIWAYAHRAGYQTIHIFAQDAPGLQNLMTINELGEIDRYITLDDVPLSERDHAVARYISRLLSDGIRQFIYVNKVGAHFPAWRTYPVEQRVYAPTLSDAVDVPSPTQRGAIKHWYDVNSVHDWRLYRNDYRNSVRWNVGGFFGILLKKGLPRGTTMLYTSDHGEYLRERDNTPRSLHGNIDRPQPEEGAVPMVVITPIAEGGEWKKAVDRKKGVSHFQLFPTLLQIFGYKTGEVKNIFGPDLQSQSKDTMTFLSNFYASSPKKADWHRIDQAAVPDPKN